MTKKFDPSCRPACGASLARRASNRHRHAEATHTRSGGGRWVANGEIAKSSSFARDGRAVLVITSGPTGRRKEVKAMTDKRGKADAIRACETGFVIGGVSPLRTR